MKTLLPWTSDDSAVVEALLAKHRLGLNDSKRLAAAVQQLSDHYLGHPDAATPWQQSWAQIAYACYYLPLNYLRVAGVVALATEVGFWHGLKHYTDFGSGLGTVSLAFDRWLPGHFASGHAVERSSQAIALHRQLHERGSGTPLTWSTTAPSLPGEGRLTSFSYALTELSLVPSWALSSDALMLIEPATHQDSRRLLGWRAELLASGWYAWAPCTHQEACPLLTESKKDWCHDRIHWQAPAWFLAMEEHLPMRNRSLTYSYLLLRKTPPTDQRRDLARLTGDLKTEKGASRQMVCRGPKREFLSWQHRHCEPPVWPRGERIALDPGTEVKSNELRPKPGQATLLGS